MSQDRFGWKNGLCYVNSGTGYSRENFNTEVLEDVVDQQQLEKLSGLKGATFVVGDVALRKLGEDFGYRRRQAISLAQGYPGRVEITNATVDGRPVVVTDVSSYAAYLQEHRASSKVNWTNNLRSRSRQSR